MGSEAESEYDSNWGSQEDSSKRRSSLSTGDSATPKKGAFRNPGNGATRTPENVLKARQDVFNEKYKEQDDATSDELKKLARDSLSTPIPQQSSARQRKIYQAGVKALGVTTEPDGDAGEDTVMHMQEIENRRENGSPDPAVVKQPVKITLDGPEEPEMVQHVDMDEEIGQDEFPNLEEFHEAEQIFGILMPTKVPTFRQRMAENQTREYFRLQSLTLEWFKSYSQRVSIGPFHRSFTCIIGPNGSGKSNTIDALLFVFGYKAKRLRATKLSELIHKSEKFPDRTWCRVTVRFARIVPMPNDPYTDRIVPGSEYSVAREAHSDNSSFYMIDSEKVQYKDVCARLRRDGIDLDHNRFLILQGEVEQIAMMKPKGKSEKDEEMLEFIEDIVGTNQYKEPIKTMAAKTEELAKSEEMENVKVHELGKQMGGMEEVKNETERFLRIDNEVIHHKHCLVQIKQHRVRKECDVLVKEVNDVAKILSDKEKKRDEILQQYKLKDKEYQDLAVYIQKSEKGDTKAEKEVTALEAESNKLKTKQKTIQELLQRLADERDKLVTQLEENESAPTRIEEELKALDENIEKSRAKVQSTEMQVTEATERLPERLGDRNQRMEEFEKDLASLRPDLLDKRRNFDNKQMEYDAFKEKFTRATKHFEELTNRKETLETDMAVDVQAIARIRAELPQKQATLDHAGRTANELSVRSADLNKQIQSKRDLIDTARVKGMGARNQNLLTKLMDAQRAGHISGVIGRLGDLGTIDARYDAAISTNFHQLDQIVVDTAESSKKIVEYLKRTNLGRITIMVYERILENGRGGHERPFRTPQNSERLFDLVTVFDERHRAMFYHHLRDTLVADNLDLAVQISAQARQNVVTLDGKRVGTDGSQTGGGEPVRGRIGTNQAQAERYIGPPVEELEAQCKELEAEALDVQQQLTQVKLEADELRPAVVKLQESLIALLKKSGNDNKELQIVIVNVGNQETMIAAAKPDPAREERFLKEIGKLQEEFWIAEGRSRQIEEKVEQINCEIEAIRKEHVDPLKKKEKEARAELTKREKRKLELTSQLQSHESTMSRIKKDFEKRSKDIESKTKEQTTVNDNLQNIQERLVRATEERDELRSKFGAQRDARTRLSTEVDKLEKQCQSSEDAVTAQRSEVDRLKSDVEKFTAKLDQYNHTLGSFKLNNVKYSDERSRVVLKDMPKEELDRFTDDMEEDVKNQIKHRELLMKTMHPKENVLKEYYEVSDKRDNVMKSVEHLRLKRKLGYSFYLELKNRRFSEFTDALRVIQSVLKTTYRQLTLGGDASLQPLDRFDPFSEGLEFMVKPKTKSWKNIGYLSGGEKTISSLALIFALHYFKPTPFYIMDEIDAALDFRNTSVIAFFVKERAVAAQFIIVSLRNQMFETAYRLIGICKPDHQSMALYIDPQKHVISDAKPEAEDDDADMVTIGRPTGSLFSQATHVG